MYQMQGRAGGPAVLHARPDPTGPLGLVPAQDHDVPQGHPREPGQASRRGRGACIATLCEYPSGIIERRQLAKASSPPSTSTSPPTQTNTGWGSSGADGAAAPAAPNAKDLWVSSGWTWPPKPGDLPKGKPNQK